MHVQPPDSDLQQGRLAVEERHSRGTPDSSLRKLAEHEEVDEAEGLRKLAELEEVADAEAATQKAV